MEKIIMIKNFSDTALSMATGEKIRNEISSAFENYDKVILDFTDISLFATPFFNACIGHFITKLSPKVFNQKISCINLSELGQETYKYSYDNAIIVYERNLSENDKKEITDIIENNINNS